MRASLQSTLRRAETDLGTLEDLQARQIRILDLINETTGSTFSAFNLNDELGRLIGGVAHPLTPERFTQVRELGPVLNILLIASPMHELLWDVGPRVAFTFPQEIFQNLQAYHQVYGPMGMHHFALYQCDPKPDGSRTLVGLSRGDRPFNTTEIRALQIICDRFTADIDELFSSGPLLPKTSVLADHRVELDRELRPRALSLYVQALFALFYGRPLFAEDGSPRLPDALIAEIRRYREEHLSVVLPASDGVAYAFTKRHRARVLCLGVQEQSDGTTWLTVQEDVSQLPRIRRVKNACAALKRDRYAVLSACLSIMEGVREPKEIARRAGLAALKSSSVARIVSRAWSIVESGPPA